MLLSVSVLAEDVSVVQYLEHTPSVACSLHLSVECMKFKGSVKSDQA